MKKLSIIIPVYNVEKYLAKCLGSVIYPNLSGYEIIVVNDGCTDSSPSIACEYEKQYPQLIRVIHKENGGLGSARNAGLDAAQGEYVQFLDSDDWLAENAVAQMLEETEKGFDIGIFDFIPVTEQGRQLPYINGCEREGMFSFEEFPELLFSPPCACNKIWRRSLFKESGIRYPDRLWFEDLATSPCLYLNSNKILHINKPFYYYLRRSGSITNNTNSHRNIEMLSVCDLVLDYYKEHNVYEKYRPQLLYMCAYNQLIASTTRVNLSDPKSEIQDRLLDWFLLNFPDYKDNKYIKTMPSKLKLLLNLTVNKRRKTLNSIMRLNNRLKNKN